MMCARSKPRMKRKRFTQVISVGSDQHSARWDDAHVGSGAQRRFPVTESPVPGGPRQCRACSRKAVRDKEVNRVIKMVPQRVLK